MGIVPAACQVACALLAAGCRAFVERPDIVLVEATKAHCPFGRSLRGGANIDRLLAQVARSLGADDDQCNAAVALLAAIEQMQGIGYHARRLVVLDGDGLAIEEGVGIG